MKRENIIIAIFACCIIILLFGNSIMLLNISNRTDPDRQDLLKVWIVNQISKGDEYVQFQEHNILNLTDMGLSHKVPNINLTEYYLVEQAIFTINMGYVLVDLMNLNENLTYEIRQPFAFDYIFNDTKQITASMMAFEGNWLSLSYVSEVADVLWVLIGNEW